MSRSVPATPSSGTRPKGEVYEWMDRPAFRVGDKVALAKSQRSLPRTRADHIASGFSSFYGGPPPAPELRKRRIEYNRPSPRPQGKKVLPEYRGQDRPEGVKMVGEPARVDGPARGKRVVVPRPSDIEIGPVFAKKGRVYDPVTGRRKAEGHSATWETHEIYGRLKRFGGKTSKTYSQGLNATDPNYPPDCEPDGTRIDYALARYGGPFADRGLRTEMVPAPVDPEWERKGFVKRGAADRLRQARKLNRMTEANQMALSMRRTGGAAGGGGAWAGAQGTVARTVSASKMGGGGGGGARPWTAASTTAELSAKDAEISRLRSELNALKASTRRR